MDNNRGKEVSKWLLTPSQPRSQLLFWSFKLKFNGKHEAYQTWYYIYIYISVSLSLYIFSRRLREYTFQREQINCQLTDAAGIQNVVKTQHISWKKINHHVKLLFRNNYSSADKKERKGPVDCGWTHQNKKQTPTTTKYRVQTDMSSEQCSLPHLESS